MNTRTALLCAALALTGCHSLPDAPASQAHAAAVSTDKAARNKANALAFYELAFNRYQVREAADKYIGSEYLQHNPLVADGKEAFVQALSSYTAKFPRSKGHIKRVIAEGDLVMLHIHRQAEPGTRGRAVVDIFRFDGQGKIVEHWDVAQDVPETTVSGRSIF